MDVKEQIDAKMEELEELRLEQERLTTEHNCTLQVLFDKRTVIFNEIRALRMHGTQSFWEAWAKMKPAGKAWLFTEQADYHSTPFELYEVIDEKHLLYTKIRTDDSDVMMRSCIIKPTKELVDKFMITATVNNIAETKRKMVQFMLDWQRL